MLGVLATILMSAQYTQYWGGKALKVHSPSNRVSLAGLPYGECPCHFVGQIYAARRNGLIPLLMCKLKVAMRITLQNRDDYCTS